MIAKRTKQEGDKFIVRFPEGSDLRERLGVVARANNRSMNGEIVARLEASFQAGGVPDFTEGEWRVEIERELEELRAQVRALDVRVPK